MNEKVHSVLTPDQAWTVVTGRTAFGMPYAFLCHGSVVRLTVCGLTRSHAAWRAMRKAPKIIQKYKS